MTSSQIQILEEAEKITVIFTDETRVKKAINEIEKKVNNKKEEIETHVADTVKINECKSHLANIQRTLQM